MGADLKADLQIPDLWYDFYSRLLPGVCFVAALRIFAIQIVSAPSSTELLILIFFGYIAGIVTQPVSSRVSGWVQDLVAYLRGKEKDIVSIVSRRLEKAEAVKERQILSKMHGEVSFFLQLGMFGVMFVTTMATQGATLRSSTILSAISVAIVAFLCAFEVADRRCLRAIKAVALFSLEGGDLNRQRESRDEEGDAIVFAIVAIGLWCVLLFRDAWAGAIACVIAALVSIVATVEVSKDRATNK
ncbi:MAG: hypothetical protein KY459_07130 [Acidobacteria bacterium]|nr:hypothetical protein [Acidobacteriota bacterium]